MTKQEQVKAIFIEEAGEIIEKLDINILRFEEDSSDFDLLNEIFRGVHTLKGNANAFGFTRLGEFVHHFEDVLDYYRSSKDVIETHNLELIVNSVDVIQEVMQCELDALPDLPDAYPECLAQIKALMSVKKDRAAAVVAENAPCVMNDLASEFTMSTMETSDELITSTIKKLQSTQTEGLNLYRIDLTLDEDAFKRGFDHILFLKLLGEHAVSLESFRDATC